MRDREEPTLNKANSISIWIRTINQTQKQGKKRLNCLWFLFIKLVLLILFIIIIITKKSPLSYVECVLRSLQSDSVYTIKNI